MKKLLMVLLSLGQTALLSFAAVAQDADDFDYWAQQCYRQRGKEGLEACDRAMSINLNDATIWTTRGAILHRDFGKYQEALIFHKRAIELDSDYSLALYNQCNTLSQLGKYNEALASCNRALEGNDNWGYGQPYLAWTAKGVALSKLGLYQKAVDSYDRAIDLDSDQKLVWNNRGVALYRLGKYQDALASFDKALEIDWEYNAAQQNRNITLRKLGS